jgi:hypothetical protein
MDGISSIQTISQPMGGGDLSQYQAGQQADPMSYEGSLTIEEGVKEPLEINILGTSEVKELTPTERMMQTVVDIDSDRDKVMSRLNDWPDFDSYLEKRGVNVAGSMDKGTGITHVSNVDDIQQTLYLSDKPLTNAERLEEVSRKMELAQERQLNIQSAATEFSRDSTVWGANMQFMMTKIKILTSAVSHVNSGLKTLFTSQ